MEKEMTRDLAEGQEPPGIYVCGHRL